MEYAGKHMTYYYLICRVTIANPDDISASFFKNKNFFGVFPEMVEFGKGISSWTLNKSFESDFDI